MKSEKEELNCFHCGRPEMEVPLFQHFAGGDGCGIEMYYLCADCESEMDSCQLNSERRF